MFIPIPHTADPAADPVLSPEDALDLLPQTMTAVQAARGARSEPPSRMRVAPARGSRQWTAHASVEAGEAFELTFTAAA